MDGMGSDCFLWWEVLLFYQIPISIRRKRLSTVWTSVHENLPVFPILIVMKLVSSAIKMVTPTMFYQPRATRPDQRLKCLITHTSDTMIQGSPPDILSLLCMISKTYFPPARSCHSKLILSSRMPEQWISCPINFPRNFGSNQLQGYCSPSRIMSRRKRSDGIKLVRMRTLGAYLQEKVGA